MKTPRSHLRRHLTYANVMASIAVFLALGGVSYAAATFNGNQIIGGTVGAGKLKNGTLTSKQVKKDSLTGSVIEEASLGTVPQAQTAVSATTAGSASTAVSAETATSASTAGDADTLDGLTASQLQVACPAETELFGGMCWDENARTARGWIAASVECGQEGGRLPSLSELIAYVLQPDEQFTGPAWTSDVVEVTGPGDPVIATRDEGTTSSSPGSSGSFGYRCLFYRVN